MSASTIRQSVGQIVFAVALVFSALVIAERIEAKPLTWLSGFHWLISSKGGFKVRLPVPLYVEEGGDREAYRGSIGCRSLENENHMHCAMTVTRFRDYRSHLAFHSDAPAEIAQEYARNLPASGGQATIASIAMGNIRGMDSWVFRLARPSDPNEVPATWVIVGISGSEWVDVVWFVPCKEHGADPTDVEKMVKSLTIFRKWGT